MRTTRQRPSTRPEEDEEGGEWGGHDAKPKKGPGDVDDVSWAIGKFFSLISFFLSTNKTTGTGQATKPRGAARPPPHHDSTWGGGDEEGRRQRGRGSEGGQRRQTTNDKGKTTTGRQGEGGDDRGDPGGNKAQETTTSLGPMFFFFFSFHSFVANEHFRY